MVRSRGDMKCVWLALCGVALVSCSLMNSLDEVEGGPIDDVGALDGGDSGVEDAAVSDSKYRAAVMADEPVGYWRLGEKTGTVAKDEIGQHNGEYVGGVTLGTELSSADGDTAVTFDGKTGKIVIGNAFGFTGSSEFSIESWIHIPDFDATRRFIVSKFAPGTKSGWYTAENNNFDGLGFGVMNLGLYSEWAAPIVPNAWVHHVGTYTSKELCAYINGNRVNCFEPGNPPADTSQPVVIGASADDDGFFKGSIDEVAIYAKALTADRIKEHYEAR